MGLYGPKTPLSLSLSTRPRFNSVARKNLTLVDEPAEAPEVGPDGSTREQLAEQAMRKSKSEFCGWSALGHQLLQWVRWGPMRWIGARSEGKKLLITVIVGISVPLIFLGLVLFATGIFGMLNHRNYTVEQTASWFASFIEIWATPLQVGVTVVVVFLAIGVFDWWVNRPTPQVGIEALRLSATDGGPVRFSIGAESPVQRSFSQLATDTYGPKATTGLNDGGRGEGSVALATTPASDHGGAVSLAEAPGSDPVLVYSVVMLNIKQHGADIPAGEARDAADDMMEELTRNVGLWSHDSTTNNVDVAVSHRVNSTGEYGLRTEDTTAIAGVFQPVIVAAGPEEDAKQAVETIAANYGRVIRGLSHVSIEYNIQTCEASSSVPQVLTESVVMRAKPLPRVLARFFGRTRGIPMTPEDLEPYLRLPELTERTRSYCRVCPREAKGNATPHGNLDAFKSDDAADKVSYNGDAGQ